MNIDTQTLTDDGLLISHAVMESMHQNKETFEIVKNKIAEYELKIGKTVNDKDCLKIEYDVKLIFEGVELDAMDFFNTLQSNLSELIDKSAKRQAIELFEKYKHEYNSKNSVNAKIDKIKQQFDKCNQELLNIKSSIDRIK